MTSNVDSMHDDDCQSDSDHSEESLHEEQKTSSTYAVQ
jgi:hypothetical protein